MVLIECHDQKPFRDADDAGTGGVAMLVILLLILLIANIPDYRIKKLAGLPRTGWRAMELSA